MCPIESDEISIPYCTRVCNFCGKTVHTFLLWSISKLWETALGCIINGLSTSHCWHHIKYHPGLTDINALVGSKEVMSFGRDFPLKTIAGCRLGPALWSIWVQVGSMHPPINNGHLWVWSMTSLDPTGALISDNHQWLSLCCPRRVVLHIHLTSCSSAGLLKLFEGSLHYPVYTWSVPNVCTHNSFFCAWSFNLHLTGCVQLNFTSLVSEPCTFIIFTVCISSWGNRISSICLVIHLRLYQKQFEIKLMIDC